MASVVAIGVVMVFEIVVLLGWWELESSIVFVLQSASAFEALNWMAVTFMLKIRGEALLELDNRSFFTGPQLAPRRFCCFLLAKSKAGHDITSWVTKWIAWQPRRLFSPSSPPVCKHILFCSFLTSWGCYIMQNYTTNIAKLYEIATVPPPCRCKSLLNLGYCLHPWFFLWLGFSQRVGFELH